MKDFIKKYFHNFVYFYRRLRYRVFIRMGLSITVGFMDGFGLAMFLPLMQMVNNKTELQPEELGNLKFIIEGFNQVGVQLNLTNILILLGVFFMCKGAAVYISGIYEVIVRQYFIKNIRISLTQDLSSLSYKAFVTADAGKIQNTLSGEVGRISQAYQHYFNTFQQIFLVAVYMIFAFFVDAKFALLITLGGLITNFLFKRIYVATKRASSQLTKDAHVYQRLILQFVANFKYLKASGGLRKFNAKLLSAIHEIEQNNQRLGKLGAIVTAVREPLLIIVVCAVIYVQVNVLDGSLGPILISLLFFYRALTALVQMQTSHNSFLAVSGSLENMTVFEQELKSNKEKDGKVEITRFSRHIDLQDVTFGYQDRPVLQNVSICVRKNQTIAFVGESGSGKTTLINLLVGLVPVDSGVMLVDGVDRNAVNMASFQRRIGYITQEPVIFNDTIFNNVTFWDRPDHTNLERFQLALKKAAILDFVEELPKKGEEMLGNNGINISGGQKQRISIARELYKDIDILVLDEATSALDSETEREIQGNIDALKGEYTILIIAHRLSTIRNVDQVVLMNKGQITAVGGYEELVSSSSTFKKMVSLQEL